MQIRTYSLTQRVEVFRKQRTSLTYTLLRSSRLFAELLEVIEPEVEGEGCDEEEGELHLADRDKEKRGKKEDDTAENGRDLAKNEKLRIGRACAVKHEGGVTGGKYPNRKTSKRGYGIEHKRGRVIEGYQPRSNPEEGGKDCAKAYHELCVPTVDQPASKVGHHHPNDTDQHAQKPDIEDSQRRYEDVERPDHLRIFAQVVEYFGENKLLILERDFFNSGERKCKISFFFS